MTSTTQHINFHWDRIYNWCSIIAIHATITMIFFIFCVCVSESVPSARAFANPDLTLKCNVDKAPARRQQVRGVPWSAVSLTARNTSWKDENALMMVDRKWRPQVVCHKGIDTWIRMWTKKERRLWIWSFGDASKCNTLVKDFSKLWWRRKVKFW